MTAKMRATSPLPPLTPRPTGAQYASLIHTGTEIRETGENTPLLFKHLDVGDDIASPPPDGSVDESWPGSEDFKGLPWTQRPSVYWLLPPFLLFALAFGGLIVPKLNLITSLICKQYFVDEQSKNPYFTFLPIVFGQANDQCRIPGVQAAVSKFTLYGNLIGGILSAISSPKLGAISDRHGRLKVIAFTTCGMFMGEVITIIAATWPDHFSVYWMLLGYVSDGMCGSFLAAMAVAHAYASDCTAPSKRAITFAYFHGCLFTGIAIGPAIAGFVIKASGHLITPFYVALGAHLIFIFCLVVVLPESLTRQRQMAARERRTMINSVVEPTSRPWRRFFLRLLKGGGLFDPLSILWPTGPGSSRAVRRNLISLAAVDTTMFGVAMGSMTVVVIYSDFMFGWGNLEQSVFLTIVNTCRVFVLLVFLPLITRLVRGTSRSEKPNRKSGADHLDLILIRVAIIFDMMGYLGYALATSGDMLKISGAIAAVGGMGSPTLQSALTKHVPADRTGQLLGAMGLLHALARIIAPTIFNFVYAQTVATLPRTVFFCLASAFGVAFVMSWFIRPHVYYDERHTPSREVSAPDVYGNDSIAR